MTRWSDERFENVIGNLLRAGVIISAVLVLAGAIFYLASQAWTYPDYGAFRGEPSDLRSAGGVVRTALSLDSRGIIQLGLLVLIATPIARVAFSVFAFAQQHDRMYVGVTLTVLALLVYSLAFGNL